MNMTKIAKLCSLNLSAKSTRTLEITLNLSKKIPNVLSIRKQIERPETY